MIYFIYLFIYCYYSAYPILLNTTSTCKMSQTPGIIRLLHSYLRGDGVHTVQLEEGIDFISLQPGGQSYDRQVSLECDPGEHYSTLYSNQQVYRPD